MNKTLRFSLLSLMMMLCGTVFADYQKVTATSDITDGDYLIVYEAENVAFNGAPDVLDAARNTVSVTVNDGIIASSADIDAAIFTFDTTEKSIKSASGYYVGAGQSFSNGLKQSETLTDQFRHTSFAIDGDGNVIITKSFGDSGDMILNFNANNSDKRFRYYKNGSQKKIQLYKKVETYVPVGDVVSDYVVDFNTAISTSDHAFKVAPGWGHIVDTYQSNYGGTMYASYAYSATSGKDGSGALTCSSNQVSNNIYDLLVTPAVSGTVTADVYLTYVQEGSVCEFYAVNEVDGKLVRGEKIALVQTIPAEEWTTVTIPVSGYQRIGIFLSYAKISNFTASEADIVLEPALTVTSISEMKIGDKTITSAAGDYAYCDVDNNVSFYFKALVANTGERATVEGEEGNSVSVVNHSDDNKVLTTVALPALAVGEETEVEFNITANYFNDFKGTNGENKRNRFDVMENFGQTSATGMWVEAVPYLPRFMFTLDENNLEIDEGQSYAFGMVSEAASKSYAIRNTGAAPLTVNSITVPEGFTVDVAGPVTLLSGTSQTIIVTFPATTPGIFQGNLVINYVDATGENVDFLFGLSGSVRDMTKFYADFEDGKFPAGTIHGVDLSVETSTTYTPTAHFMQSGSVVEVDGTLRGHSQDQLFITPLLHAQAGEIMSFDVARRGTSTSDGYGLDVYYSTDRNRWTLLHHIANSELPTETVSSGYFSSEYVFGNFTVEMPAARDYYIGFVAGYVRVDNIYGLTPVDIDHDILFSVDLPTEGMNNHDLNVKVTWQNVLGVAEKGTLTYYYGNDKVFEEAVEMEAGNTDAVTKTIVYTPREAGQFNTYVVLKLEDGTEYMSPVTKFTVAEEAVDGTVAVFTGSTSTQTTAPVYTTWGYSDAEIIYPVSDLEACGITEGMTIYGLSFKGYRVNSEKTFPLTIWMEETTDESPVSSGTTFVGTTLDDSKKIYDNESFVLAEAGTSDNHVALIKVTFDEPYVYQGGNLRIAVRGQQGGGGISGTNWEAYDGTSKTKYRKQDGSLSALENSSSWTTTKNPVLYLDTDREAAKLTGVLSIDNYDGTNTPIANTVITLKNGNIFYSGTTDEQGAFSIQVMQDDLTYSIEFEYTDKNYFPLEEGALTVSFARQDIVKNITLTEAKDFLIETAELPTLGKVDTEYVATVTATNYNATALAADAYTATLLINGEAAAQAETVEIGSMAQHTFTFSYVPTEAGTISAQISLKTADTERLTDAVEVTVEPKHNVTVEFSNIPATGEVNSELSARVKVANTLHAAEAADSYTLKLYVNDVAEAEAQSVALDDIAKYFSLAFTPHAAGTLSVVAKVEFGDGEVFQSEAASVEVAAEAASAGLIVGTTSGTDYEYGFCNFYYNNSQGEAVYTPQLLGIPAGTVLNGFSILGTASATRTSKYEIWVENTGDEAPASDGTTPVSTDNMTKVYDSEQTNVTGVTGTEILKFTFTEPFTYTGSNLRIYISRTGSSWSNSISQAYDNTVNGKCKLRKNDNATSLLSTSFASTYLPVIKLDAEVEPTVFSGVLNYKKTDGTTQAVAGATVRLTSGNVQYFGETGAEGAFSFPVIQNTKTYEVSVENLPADVKAFPLKKTVEFVGASISENIELEEAAGFYFVSVDAADKGTINNAYHVTVEATNYEATAVSGYAAQLFVDGEVAATAAAPEVASEASQTYEFVYTPHVAGEHTAFVKLGEQQSETFTFTVDPELAEGEVQVGNNKNTSSYVPFYFLYADNTVGGKSDFAYTPEMLAAFGITEGTTITAISYEGTVSSAKEYSSLAITAYVGLQETYAKGDWTGLTEIIVQEAQATSHASNATVKNTITLPEPIVYDGVSVLHVGTLVNGNGYWSNVKYPIDTDYTGLAVYGYGSGNPSSAAEGVPVALFTVKNGAHFAGTLTTAGEAVADATVTLKSGDVIYTGTTDAEGKYDVTVIQADKDYDVQVTNIPAGTYQAGKVSLADGDVEKDIDLTPVAEGVYYLYNELADVFMSRGSSWGTRAVADNYGLPVNVTLADGKYTLQMLDNGVYYGDDYWMYADCSGDRVRSYTIEAVEGGYKLHNTARLVDDNCIYVYLKDDADKYAIAGNAILNDNISDEKQAVWQFVSADERDAMIAAAADARDEAAIGAAGLTDKELANDGEPKVLTFTTGSEWTFSAWRNGSNYATNDNGTEVYQGTGAFTQSVSNLTEGLYEVSIQAFYRDGGNAAVAAFTDEGYNLSVAYLQANDAQIQINSWGIDRADDGNPNSMTEAKALFDEGKYLVSGYVYVGAEGQLDLTVAVPSYIGYGWFIADNVTIQKVGDATTVGIQQVANSDRQNTPAFNMAGQRVDNNYRGLIITNGRKVNRK